MVWTKASKERKEEINDLLLKDYGFKIIDSRFPNSIIYNSESFKSKLDETEYYPKY